MDIGIIVTVTGVVVAGFAAVLGIWMERDDRKPPRYAYALSGLILLATVVSVMQSYLDARASEKLEEDMARMIQKMDQIAANSNDPELMALIKDELNAQSRANPDVVEKLAQRVSDNGGDPAQMLGKHIDAAELEGISRKGLIKTKKRKVAKANKKKKAKEETKDAAPATAKPKKVSDIDMKKAAKTDSATKQEGYKQKSMDREEANKRRALMEAQQGGAGAGRPGAPGMPPGRGRGSARRPGAPDAAAGGRTRKQKDDDAGGRARKKKKKSKKKKKGKKGKKKGK